MTAYHNRVIIIDDHPLFRKGAADLVKMEGSLEFVGEAASGEEGIKLALAQNPDLILLDLNMKGMDGLETLKALRSNGGDARVIMLTVSDDESDVVSALRAGADGYLLKDMEPEDIVKELHRAGQGHIVLSDSISQLIALSLRDESAPDDADEAGLTTRETEILMLISTGMSNKLIARELGIVEGTVKVHVKHLLRKLSLRSRVEAAVWAVEHM
ncbi:MAG: two-component system response regulator NarL [bacterium]|nr:two-component system response regulator NarL [bacterium]